MIKQFLILILVKMCIQFIAYIVYFQFYRYKWKKKNAM